MQSTAAYTKVEGRPNKNPKVSKESAVKIARDSFAQTIGGVETYDYIVYEEADRWRIIFDHKYRGVKGGSAIYFVNNETGVIESKQIFQ